MSNPNDPSDVEEMGKILDKLAEIGPLSLDDLLEQRSEESKSKI